MTTETPEARAQLGEPTWTAVALGWVADLPVRVWKRLRGMSIWAWGVVALIVAFTWYFTWLSLDMHYGLGTSSYDYGLYDQGVWLMSRFKAPFVTLMGRNLLGDHTSFILVFLVPVYWIMPGAGALLGTQALAAAVSSIPVYLYARERLSSGALALGIAALYLTNPALRWAVLEDFHPDVYLAPLLMFAIYAALTSRWRMLVISVMLSLLVKEDVSLVMVPLGIWVALRRDRKIGLGIVLASLMYGFFAVVIVMRGLLGNALPNAWRIPFGGVTGSLKEILHWPGNVIDYLKADGRPWYVWQMLTPFAGLFARLPDVALISVVVLGTNVVSNFWYQHQIQYHYSVAVIPGLALGTVYALGAFKGRWRTAAVVLLAASSLWTAHLWGPAPFGRMPLAYWTADFPVAAAAQDIIEDVPDDAVVSAHHGITPHLARREQIYAWPNPFFRVLYGTDISLEGTRMPEADDVEYLVVTQELIDEDPELWLEVSAAFRLVRSNQWWFLYERIP